MLREFSTKHKRPIKIHPNTKNIFAHYHHKRPQTQFQWYISFNVHQHLKLESLKNKFLEGSKTILFNLWMRKPVSQLRADGLLKNFAKIMTNTFFPHTMVWDFHANFSWENADLTRMKKDHNGDHWVWYQQWSKCIFVFKNSSCECLL